MAATGTKPPFGNDHRRQLRRPLPTPTRTLLNQAMTELGLSARAHNKILRVARTIADLGAVEDLAAEHLAEAIHYRRLDRQL